MVVFALGDGVLAGVVLDFARFPVFRSSSIGVRLPDFGSRLPRTTFPWRSTIAPTELTTVKTAIFVSPTWRNAPPCPDRSRYSGPKYPPAWTNRPAPRGPRANRPGLAALKAARPSSLSGWMTVVR